QGSPGGYPDQEFHGVPGETEPQLLRRCPLPQPPRTNLRIADITLAAPARLSQELNRALAQMIPNQLDRRPAQARRGTESTDQLQGALPWSILQKTLQDAQQVRLKARNGSHDLTRPPRCQIPTACFAGKPLIFNSRPDSRISSVLGS